MAGLPGRRARRPPPAAAPPALQNKARPMASSTDIIRRLTYGRWTNFKLGSLSAVE